MNNKYKLLCMLSILLSTPIAHSMKRKTPDSITSHSESERDAKNAHSATQEMLKAAQEGNLNSLKEQIRLGTDVNTQDSDGNTPLHLAIINEHADILNELLMVDTIDFNIFNQEDKTPLLLAIKKGRRAFVQALMHAGANPNIGRLTPREYYNSPLHLAIRYGRLDIVQEILKAPSTKIDIIFAYHTPLIVACLFRQPTIAKTLLDAGANYQLASSTATTPLNLARREPHMLQVFQEFATGPAATFLRGQHQRLGVNSPTILLNRFGFITEYIGRMATNADVQTKEPQLL